MYVYSDCQKVESLHRKGKSSRNVNFFCGKTLDSTITTLKNSLTKKKEFLIRVEKDNLYNTVGEILHRKLAKSNSDVPYNKYNNYRNWVQNIRVLVQPDKKKREDTSKTKFYHELNQEKIKETILLDDGKSEKRKGRNHGREVEKKPSFFNNIVDYRNDNFGIEERSKTIQKLDKNKEEPEEKFWEYDETIKDKETKVIFRKIFDKKLVSLLKLDGKIEKDNKKDYKKIKFVEDENLKYVNEKIGKIKKNILFMKGVFDYAFPKMMIQRLKGVKNSESPKLEKTEVEQKYKVIPKKRSVSQGLNVVELSPYKTYTRSTKESKLNTCSTTGFEYYSKVSQKRRDEYQKKSLLTNMIPKIKVISPFCINS